MISSQRVHEIIRSCLFEKAEDSTPENTAFGEGVLLNVGLNKTILESYREEVREMLNQLPDPFHAGTGGGWSFLNLCQDKTETLWGEHNDCDALVALGNALGYAKVAMKEMASFLPGGMPYVVINTKSDNVSGDDVSSVRT